jgi:5-formyltetrahydrofolate cyclo-ligase
MRQLSEKARLRVEILGARRGTPLELRRSADEAIALAAAELVRSRRVGVVAAYAPLAAEPGGAALLPALTSVVPRVLLPVLLPDLDLDWAWSDAPATPLGADAVGTAEVIFTPAVAVGADGRRLGRGGGSYDRALTRAAPAALVVALLYDGELLPSVPAQPHDQRVHAVITPENGLVALPLSAGSR